MASTLADGAVSLLGRAASFVYDQLKQTYEENKQLQEMHKEDVIKQYENLLAKWGGCDIAYFPKDFQQPLESAQKAIAALDSEFKEKPKGGTKGAISGETKDFLARVAKHVSNLETSYDDFLRATKGWEDSTAWTKLLPNSKSGAAFWLREFGNKEEIAPSTFVGGIINCLSDEVSHKPNDPDAPPLFLGKDIKEAKDFLKRVIPGDQSHVDVQAFALFLLENANEQLRRDGLILRDVLKYVLDKNLPGTSGFPKPSAPSSLGPDYKSLPVAQASPPSSPGPDYKTQPFAQASSFSPGPDYKTLPFAQPSAPSSPGSDYRAPVSQLSPPFSPGPVPFAQPSAPSSLGPDYRTLPFAQHSPPFSPGPVPFAQPSAPSALGPDYRTPPFAQLSPPFSPGPVPFAQNLPGTSGFPKPSAPSSPGPDYKTPPFAQPSSPRPPRSVSQAPPFVQPSSPPPPRSVSQAPSFQEYPPPFNANTIWVRDFFETLGEQFLPYSSVFVEAGYDTKTAFKSLTKENLKDLKVKDGHQQYILDGIQGFWKDPSKPASGPDGSSQRIYPSSAFSGPSTASSASKMWQWKTVPSDEWIVPDDGPQEILLDRDQKQIYFRVPKSFKCYVLNYTVDGKKVETKPTTFPKSTTLNFDAEGVLYGVDNSSLFTFNLKEGKKLSSHPLPKLSQVRRVKVDEKLVYVTTEKHHEIFLYTKEGKQIKSFGTKGSGEAQFLKPKQLTLDEQYLYICDFENHRVQVLDKTTGEFVSQWGRLGTDRGFFTKPWAISLPVDGEQILYVGDSMSVQMFTCGGVFLQRLGAKTTGSAATQFYNVRGLLISNGRLYVSDGRNHRVKVFEQEDVKGSAPSTFSASISPPVKKFRWEPIPDDVWPIPSSSPRGMVCDTLQEKIYLLSKKISLVSYTLDQKRTDMKPNVRLSSAMDLDLDTKKGYLYVIDGSNLYLLNLQNAQKIATYRLHVRTGKARSFKVDENAIYVTIGWKHQVFVYSKEEGKYFKSYGPKSGGTGEGQFKDPRGITVDKQFLYICDSANHRIQVVEKNSGEFHRQWGRNGTDRGCFTSPMCIFLLTDGRDQFLYVGDMISVQMFTFEGAFLQRIGEKVAGAGKAQFKEVRGIFTYNKRLYVSDFGNSRLQIFKQK